MADTRSLLRGFLQPQDDFRPAAMWFVNDTLSFEELTAQLESFRAGGVTNLFFNPTYGFPENYLDERYFTMVRHAVLEAKRLGLHFWIYDEYEFPSGIAGGLLLRDRPDLRARVLCGTAVPMPPGYQIRRRYIEGRPVRIFRRFPDSPEAGAADVTDEVTVESMGDGFVVSYENLLCGNIELYVVSERLQKNVLSAAIGARFSFSQDGYIDPLREEAIRAFIDYTHERYKAAVGDEFGKTVKGVFTDEVCVGDPHELGSGRVPWNDELSQRFRDRWGYDPEPWLYALTDKAVTPREKKARYDFWRLLTERVRDAHIKQVYDWCAENGLAYTGHFDGEESMIWSMYQSGDIFDLMPWLHVPGIDAIFTRDRIDDENFNVAGKILSSCARWYDRSRTLCETYTGSSFRLRFGEMRRIANRLMILGVNMLQYMGAHYSLDNQRKSWKPSFGYQNTLFERFGCFGDYVARIQYVSAQTRAAGKVLLMCPQAGVYTGFPAAEGIFGAYYDRANPAYDSVRNYDATMIGLVNTLLSLNIEFDMFSDSMAGQVTAADGCASLYGAAYDTVILPNTHDTTAAVAAMAERLRDAGVRVIFIDDLPTLAADRAEALSPFGEAPADGALQRLSENVYFFAEPTDGKLRGHDAAWRRKLEAAVGAQHRTLGIRHDGNILTALRRSSDGTQVVFLANDCGEPRRATFDWQPGMRLLDPETGCAAALPASGGVAQLEFAPYQFWILISDGAADVPAQDAPATAPWRTLPSWCGFEAPNTLTARWKYARCAENGDLPDEAAMTLLDREGSIPAPGAVCGGKGALIFDFDAQFLPEKVELFAEYGHVLRCELNGVRIDEKWQKCRLWGPHDASLDVTALLRTGKNRITALFELPDYATRFFVPFVLLRGDFETDGASLLPRRGCYTASPIDVQGWPQLTGPGTYRFRVTLSAAEAAQTAAVSLDSLDACELFVNGVSAGVRLWPPFRFGTEGLFREGENTVDVRMSLPMHNLFCPPEDRIAVGLTAAPRLERRAE